MKYNKQHISNYQHTSNRGYYNNIFVVVDGLMTIKKQILVVDDELDICLVLKIVLENNGFIVDYYCNPILALNEFKSNFYDLIILDIQMPDMNGLQLYKEVKKGILNQKYVL